METKKIQLDNQTDRTRLRINKYLSEAGFCSRRKADEYIEQGRVTIHGVPVKKGSYVSADEQVEVDGVAIHLEEQKVVLAFYKPRGVVCSANGQGSQTVQEYLKYPISLSYVGRLDKDSEGLLLLTNDGELANAVSKARNGHEKEYEVTVNRPVTKGFLQRMSKGVPILDTVTQPCRIRQTGERMFTIILTQGLNRQIRRMCEACGYRVRRLKRIRVMNITLDGLETGAYRELLPEEEKRLRQLCQMGKKQQ